MLTIGRGQHGSTYGGNPVAAKVAVAALQVIVDEQLPQRSDEMGQLLRQQLMILQDSTERIATVCDQHPAAVVHHAAFCTGQYALTGAASI